MKGGVVLFDLLSKPSAMKIIHGQSAVGPRDAACF
jgi:hypothetical protein